MGSRIESFEDLDVYKLALELQQDVFELTKMFPEEETYCKTIGSRLGNMMQRPDQWLPKECR